MEPGSEGSSPADGASAAADPEPRPIYVQMAVDHNKNPGRPFDMAFYPWYVKRQNRRGKRIAA
jgi:hypothetical protein